MISFPLGQLAAGGAALLLLVAYGWACYLWGRSAERAKTLKVILDAEREVQHVLEQARRDPVRVTPDWLRRGGPPTGGAAPLSGPPPAR